jgi:hypothetical protein
MSSGESFTIIVAVYMVWFITIWQLRGSVQGREHNACACGCGEYYHDCLVCFPMVTSAGCISMVSRDYIQQFMLAILRRLLIDMATCNNQYIVLRD